MKTRSEVRKLILLVDKDEEKKMAWWSELNQGQRGESGQRQVNRMESDWLNLLRFLLTGGLSGNAVSNTLSASEQIRLIGPIRTTPLPFNDLLQLNCRSRTESKNTRSAPPLCLLCFLTSRFVTFCPRTSELRLMQLQLFFAAQRRPLCSPLDLLSFDFADSLNAEISIFLTKFFNRCTISMKIS